MTAAGFADIPSLPGVTVYGSSKDQARSKVQALALRVIADQIERDLKLYRPRPLRCRMLAHIARPGGLCPEDL